MDAKKIKDALLGEEKIPLTLYIDKKIAEEMKAFAGKKQSKLVEEMWKQLKEQLKKK